MTRRARLAWMIALAPAWVFLACVGEEFHSGPSVVGAPDANAPEEGPTFDGGDSSASLPDGDAPPEPELFHCTTTGGPDRCESFDQLDGDADAASFSSVFTASIYRATATLSEERTTSPPRSWLLETARQSKDIPGDHVGAQLIDRSVTGFVKGVVVELQVFISTVSDDAGPAVSDPGAGITFLGLSFEVGTESLYIHQALRIDAPGVAVGYTLSGNETKLLSSPAWTRSPSLDGWHRVRVSVVPTRGGLRETVRLDGEVVVDTRIATETTDDPSDPVVAFGLYGLHRPEFGQPPWRVFVDDLRVHYDR